jgi:hypothetical protein
METHEYYVIVSTDSEEEFMNERKLFDMAKREARYDLALNLKFKKGEPRQAFTTQSGGEYYYWLSFPITPRKGLLLWMGLALDKILEMQGKMVQMSDVEMAETFGDPRGKLRW